MKVVHLSKSDFIGGAAKAAIRLQDALLNRGIESQMLVHQKMTGREDVTQIGSSIYDKIEFRYNILKERIRTKEFQSNSGAIMSTGMYGIDLNFSRYLNDTDIVHLHWINSNFISIRQVNKISRRKPVIWTFHDSWPFTGGCHVRFNCERYQDGCGKCPFLNSKDENDITRKIFLYKQRIYKKN